MKAFSILVLILISINACNQPVVKDDKLAIASKNATNYGDFVPIVLGIHNEYPERDSFKIEMINSFDSVAFFHKGPMAGGE